MKTDVPKDVQAWGEIRKKGRFRFLLINGVLCWGVPMFLIMSFLNPGGKPGLTATNVAIAAIIFPLGGLGFGWSMWHFNERRYRKYLGTNAAKAASE